MEAFSDDFRRRFSKPEILDDIQRECAQLESLKRARVDVPTLVPDFYQKGKMPRLPLKLMMLTQNAIRRGLELADSMIRDTNAFSYTPVFTSSRSLFELSSLIFDAYDKMSDLYSSWDMKRYLEFSEHLDNVILGWKSEEWHPSRDKPEELELRAKNILSIMQRIDKKHIPGFFSMYELLSEVAHPNYMGMMEAYCKIGEELLTIDFFDSPTRLDTERISIALSNGEGALAMLAETIQKFETIFVPFSKLASEMIRHDDSFPALRDWDRPIR